MICRFTLTFFAIIAGIVSTTEAIAQRPSSRRPPDRSNTLNTMVGVHLNASTLSFNGEDMELGFGGGMVAGFGLTRKFMLYGEYDAARVDINSTGLEGSYTLAQGDFGLRYSFANEKRAWIPYINTAFNVRRASAQIPANGGTQDFSFSGPGFTIGGGTQYFVNRKVALDFGLRYAIGQLGRITIGNQPIKSRNISNSTSIRFLVGLRFHPQVPEP